VRAHEEALAHPPAPVTHGEHAPAAH